MHVDDSFDGRIRYSDLKLAGDDNQPWNSESCLAKCKKATVLNCEYNNKGICKYQLGEFNGERNKNFDCVISIVGVFFA